MTVWQACVLRTGPFAIYEIYLARSLHATTGEVELHVSAAGHRIRTLACLREGGDGRQEMEFKA